MPPTQPDPPSRPRTRSWTKKEEEAKSKQNVNAKRRLDPSVLPDSSKGPQTRAQARLEKKTKAQSPSTKSLPKPLPSTQRGHRVQQKESASRQSAKRHKKPSNKLSKGRSSRRSITEPKKTPIPAQLQGSRSSRKQVGRRRRSQPSPTNNLERRSTTSPQKDKPIEKPNEKPHSDEQYPTSQANGRGSPSGNRSSILIDKGTRKDQPSQRFDEQLTTKAAPLSIWLRQVGSVSPDRALEGLPPRAPIPPALLWPEHVMNSSSTSKATTEAESTAPDTLRPVKAKRPGKLSENALRVRRVSRKAQQDERKVYLQGMIKSQLPELLLKDDRILALKSVAQDFVDAVHDHAAESCYEYIDSFSINLDKGKAEIGFPIINSKYFDAYLERCLSKNEAVLQRTIMMSVFDQHHLDPKFDWNAEGQWSQLGPTSLPSRENDSISQPKPDLAISFTLESFTGSDDDSDPIPDVLKPCLYPDGGNRCFPFLFMEVKKAATDLQAAYLANLHTASQALWNIYHWVMKADREDIKDQFFKEARVFSVVFNAQDLDIRVHRAALSMKGDVVFHFDHFKKFHGYKKDEACVLISNILRHYAVDELFPFLKSIFRVVVEGEDEEVQIGKRKASASQIAAAKRPRQSRTSSQNTTQGESSGQHTNISFQLQQAQVSN